MKTKDIVVGWEYACSLYGRAASQGRNTVYVNHVSLDRYLRKATVLRVGVEMPARRDHGQATADGIEVRFDDGEVRNLKPIGVGALWSAYSKAVKKVEKSEKAGKEYDARAQKRAAALVAALSVRGIEDVDWYEGSEEVELRAHAVEQLLGLLNIPNPAPEPSETEEDAAGEEE